MPLSSTSGDRHVPQYLDGDTRRCETDDTTKTAISRANMCHTILVEQRCPKRVPQTSARNGAPNECPNVVPETVPHTVP